MVSCRMIHSVGKNRAEEIQNKTNEAVRNSISPFHVVLMVIFLVFFLNLWVDL